MYFCIQKQSCPPPKSVGKESQPSAKLDVWKEIRDSFLTAICNLPSPGQASRLYRAGVFILFGHPALTLCPAAALWCLRYENGLDCSKLLNCVNCIAKPKQILLLWRIKLPYVQANTRTIHFTNCMAHSLLISLCSNSQMLTKAFCDLSFL